jgi:ABC-type dipeptide/oligopeptide/nickel transport system ATPase component
MKIIAIGGEPGAGKSTLMKKVLEILDKNVLLKCYDSFKLVPYIQCGSVYILGKYDEGETFSGTDRMSMAVQPEAVKFLASLPNDSVVLFEGDRLFTASFLEHCVENYDTDILYLETDKSIREDRYKERGSNQNETWLRGRESKIANILSNMTLMFNTSKFKNNTLQDQEIIVDYIMNRLEA